MKILDGGCVLIEFPRCGASKLPPPMPKKPKLPKPRRPMTDGEIEIVTALQNYCSAGHWLPIWEWKFLQSMVDHGPITDKQGDYIRSLAARRGVGAGLANAL